MSTKFRIRRVMTLLTLVVALGLPLTVALPESAEGGQAYGNYTMWWVYNGYGWVKKGEEGTLCDGTPYSWGEKTDVYTTANHCTEW